MLEGLHKKRGFTLIEMLMVLIIMWILLMVTMGLSWDQIQKVKNKTVKESILEEWQIRYSRNLWSSSFAWTIYDTMKINLETGLNQINFLYVPRVAEENMENIFTDKFEIKYIATNYFEGDSKVYPNESISLQYKPYQIYCKMWWDDEKNFLNTVLVVRVNDNQDYCFEIQSKNCRLVEMSESRCNNLKNLAEIYD